MGFPRLNYTKLWTNPTDFPTVELDETKVRADMQALHDETKTGLNLLMDRLEGKAAAGSLGATANDGSTASTVQKELDALNKALTDAGNLPTGGSAGQLLWKQSGQDFDTKWHSPTASELGVFGVVGEIPAGADLDSYTALGSYFCAGGNAAGVANSPVQLAFHLYVLQAQDARVIQILTVTSANDAQAALYYRKRASAAWGSWKTLATAGDLAQYLPLAGGEVSGTVKIGANGWCKQLEIHRAETTGAVGIKFSNPDGQKGVFCFNQNGDPTVYLGSDTGTAQKLFHTGNVGELLGASRIVAGTYTGNSTTPHNTLYEQTISLGFTPKMVVVFTEDQEAVSALPGSDFVPSTLCTALKVVSGGFTAAYYYYSPANDNSNPSRYGINHSGDVYRYIAIG